MKKNPFLNLFSFSWSYSPKKKFFVLYIVLSIVANSIDLFDMILVGRVFNSVQFDSADPGLLQYIITNLILLILVKVGFWVFHGPARVLEMRNAFLVRKNYKQKMFNKVLELPIEWQKDHHSGDTIDKINKSSEALFGFSESLFLVITNVVSLVGSVIILSFFDWKMTIVAIVMPGLAIWTSIKFDKLLTKNYNKIYKAENYLASAIHDYISNIITIVSLRLKKKVSNEIDSRSMASFDVFIKNNKLNELKWFSISFYLALAVSGVLIFNAYYSYTTTGVIVIGTMYVLYSSLKNIGNFFFNFAWLYTDMTQKNEAVVLAEPINKAYNKTIIEKVSYGLPEDWRLLQIKNLFFSYKKKSDKDYIGDSLNDISLTIEKNSKIALIGESGSGKSTILSLIRNLYNADKCDIYCDGKKLPNGLKHLREHTALIPQEPEIFNASVYDNITMDIKTKKTEVEKVIEFSKFDIVLNKLRRGLETNVLEKGVSLSGGEKQRLALARGLLMADNYDLLLLDEPTSSVDSDNELKIYINIFENYKNKTIISSIHRLHLLRYFDYIYFFEKGKIVTEGTFNTLLKDERFKLLWENYSKVKNEDAISK